MSDNRFAVIFQKLTEETRGSDALLGPTRRADADQAEVESISELCRLAFELSEPEIPSFTTT